MSEFQSWLNTIGQLGLAIGVFWGIYQNVMNKRAITLAAAHSLVTSQKLDIVAEDVRKVELASNSMKDALVTATAIASNLQGRAEQRAETDAKTT